MLLWGSVLGTGALAQGLGHLYVMLVESASTRCSFCSCFQSFWCPDGLRTSRRYSGAAVSSQPLSRPAGELHTGGSPQCSLSP